MQVFTTDVLCIGAGLAGERVAVEAAMSGFETICLSLVPPRRSHSSAAQGGMQAALGNAIMGDGDSPDIHFADTVKGSDWGCDQEVAHIFRLINAIKNAIVDNPDLTLAPTITTMPTGPVRFLADT